MKKVIITKGLPGSGKSTWARELISDNPNTYKRVNKDELRAMMDNSIYSKDSEKFVLQIRDAIILSALENGKHVIVDDTNLSPKHESHIRELVKGKAIVEIQDFTNVPIDLCITRDLQRCASVGEKVIRGMYNQFIKKQEEYEEDNTLPKAIIVDVDGTLSKMKDRGPFDWDKVGQDECNQVIKNIVNNYPNTVILISGRDGSCTQQTTLWLEENEIKFDRLLMRGAGNTEKDSIVKRRMFDYFIKGKYFIEYVLDDRNQVVEMWRNMGLTCLQVADGDF